MMFVGCVVVCAAAVNCGHFVDAAVVLAAAAVMLAAECVWSADITGMWCCDCFAVEPGCGSVVELLHVAE